MLSHLSSVLVFLKISKSSFQSQLKIPSVQWMKLYQFKATRSSSRLYVYLGFPGSFSYGCAALYNLNNHYPLQRKQKLNRI